MMRNSPTTDYKMITTKLEILNFTSLTILLFLMQTIPLANSIDNPTNPLLLKLLKVKEAKQLRNDLFSHINVVEKMMKYLDEWSINEIKEITNNQDLNEQLIEWLKNELKQTKQNVNNLLEDISNIDDSVHMHAIKLKYNDLYIYIQNLGEKYIVNNRNTFRLLKEYFGESFPNFPEQHNSLLYQIQTVYKFIVDRENIILSNECIKEIREKEFEKAAVKYGSIKDDHTLTHIVKEVYNSSENNFDLIINFANKVSNISQSFIVYSALIYEMEISNQNKNPYRIVELVKNIKTEIINQIKLNIKMKNDALSLEEFLTNKLKQLAKENLKKTILDDKYSINIPLFEQILLLDENIFSDLSYIVLLEFYNDSKVKPIFGLIIEAFTNIFDKIFKNHLDNKSIFKLAYYINSLLEKSKQSSELTLDVRFSESDNLSRILAERMDYYINKLPESIKNIVFNKSICIINIGLNEYLYSTNNTIGVNKYSVFTNVNKKQVWKITRSYDYIYNIQNYLQNLSYLYTDDDDNNDHKSDGHNVFTWMEASDILGIWQIEPLGNDCLIKNLLHNEYLYVSEETNHVVLTKDIVNNISNNFKWRFINCNSS